MEFSLAGNTLEASYILAGAEPLLFDVERRRAKVNAPVPGTFSRPLGPFEIHFSDIRPQIRHCFRGPFRDIPAQRDYETDGGLLYLD